MEMEKTEIGEEILPVFGGKQQRRTASFPNLPSLLFFSLSLSILDLVTPTRRAWLRVWRWGRGTVHGRGPARLVT